MINFRSGPVFDATQDFLIVENNKSKLSPVSKLHL